MLLSGMVYTARDAAHRRLCETLEAGEPLPVHLKGQTLFYAGPTPSPPGKPLGVIGPTTSMRMDAYTPALLHHGVNALIGKGERSEAINRAIQAAEAVYFAAIAGCAAHLAACVTDCQVAAYDDLGAEAIKRLMIRDLPLIVATDAYGINFYAISVQRYLHTISI